MHRTAVAFALLTAAAAAHAEPVFRLDPSFGDNGVATYSWPVDMGYQWNAADAWATRLADGKWAMLAQLRIGTSQSGQVNWFNADGSITPASPGMGPYTPFGMGGWNAAGIAQSYIDGSLTLLTGIVRSASDIDFRLWRTRADGNGEGYSGCAGSFWNNVPFDLAPPNDMEDVPRVLLQDNAGRMVMAGTGETANNESRMVVARVMPDCWLDNGFGTSSGRYIVPVANAKRMRVHAAAFDLQARILVGGGYSTETGSNPDGRCVIARLTANGLRDTSFGSDGVATINRFSVSGGKWRCDVRALAVDNAGRIYAHGNWRAAESLDDQAQRDFLLRFLPNGTRDTSFDSSPWGIANVDVIGGGIAVFEGEGKIVTAYTEQTRDGPERSRGELAVFNTADGSYDLDGFLAEGQPLDIFSSRSYHRIVQDGPDMFYVLATSGPDYLTHHKVHLIRYRRASTIPPPEPADRLFQDDFE